MDYAREKLNGTATIKMLVDYEIPDSDKVTLNQATDRITFTTAAKSGGTYNFVDTKAGKAEADKGTAILTRDYDGASLFTVSGGAGLTFNKLILDGDKANHTATGDGGLVSANASNVTLNTGAVLRNAKTSANGGAIATTGGTLTVNSGAKITGCESANGGGVSLGANGTLTMTGGEIKNNTVTTTGSGTTGNGGGVDAGAGAVITMSGGKISGNTVVSNNKEEGRGGGVCLRGASMTLSGTGEISGNKLVAAEGAEAPNKNRREGGGVYVGASGLDSSLTMTGGKITGNNANIGGGVATGYTGVFTMAGGEMSGNTASGGGAIYQWSSSAVTVSGGTITDNTAAVGSAILVHGEAARTVNLSGGEITGNTATNGTIGGAINVNERTAVLNFSGNVQVKENTTAWTEGGESKTETRNVVLNHNTNNVIQTGQAGLSEAANVGIYVTGTMTGTETEPYKTHGGLSDDFGTFFNSNTGKANLHCFHNDRNGYFGEEDKKNAGQHLILWARYVCKIVQTNGKEVAFPLLTEAVQYSRNNRNLAYADAGNTRCKIEMLVDYDFPGYDAVNLDRSTDNILFTTASKTSGTYKYTGNGAYAATLKRNAPALEVQVHSGYFDKDYTEAGAFFQVTHASAKMAFQNIILDGNKAQYLGRGIIAMAGTVNVLEGTELNNFRIEVQNSSSGSSNYGGAAIRLGNGVTLNIAGTADRPVRITNNEVAPDTNYTNKIDGGAIVGTFEDTITIDHAEFRNNTVTTKENYTATGGAIGLTETHKKENSYGKATLTVSNTVFDRNTAKTNGGAIRVTENTDVTLTNCKFTNNTATGGGGGAVIVHSKPNTDGNHYTVSTLTINGGRFENNTTGGGTIIKNGNESACFHGGGAVRVDDGTTLTIQKYNGNLPVFKENSVTSGNGGALSVGLSTANIEGNFYGNTANQNGGALYLGKTDDGVSGTLSANFKDGHIGGSDTNKAKKGSAVYVNSGSATFSGGEITGNEVDSNTGAVEVESSAVRLYFSGSAVVYDNKYTVVYDNKYSSQQKNVVLNDDNNAVINAANAGLSANAHIGVYVTGDDSTNPYKEHGTLGLPFGTWVNDENLGRFSNDRNDELFGVNYLGAGKSAPDTLIYWGRYICKIVDNDNVEHPFATLNAAVEYSRENRANAYRVVDLATDEAVCTIEMLVDYVIPESDRVTLATDNIIITTAATENKLPSGQKYFFAPTFTAAQGRNTTGDDKDSEEIAILQRGWDGETTEDQALFYLENSAAKLTTGDILFDANSKVDNGSLTQKTGRAIYVNSGKLAADGKTTFRNFNVSGNGGAVYAASALTYTVSSDADVRFDQCSATNGGAVYAANDLTCTVSQSGNVRFDGCTATSGGGGIYANAALTITGEGDTTKGRITFTGCKATNSSGSGGGIYQGSAGDMTLTNVIFGESGNSDKGCFADANGGSVYSLGKNITMTDCEFYYSSVGDDNQSKSARGGAVYNYSSNEGVLYQIQGCVFDHCSTHTTSNARGNGNGGAIYVEDVATLTIKESSTRRTSFTDCTGRRYGGAVCFEKDGGTTLNILNTDFQNCRTDYRGGGAVYSDSTTKTTFEGCTFTKCYAAPIKAGDAASQDRSGGAIQMNGDTSSLVSTITINSCQFDDCYAEDNGGAIFFASSGTNATLTNVQINGHTTGKTTSLDAGTVNAALGGAIYSKGNLTIAQTGGGKSEIKNCSASTAANGGAVNVLSGSVSFEGDVVVYDNMSTKGSQKVQANVVLDQDNNTTIKTTADGLGANAHIGVYVVPAQFAGHGEFEKDFGTYQGSDNSKENLNRFTNDVNGFYGELCPDHTANKLIRWQSYVLKLTDESENLLFYKDGDEYRPALYNTLKEGFAAAAGALYSLSGDVYAPIEADAPIKACMLRNYTQPGTDTGSTENTTLTNTAARDVTFTTAGTSTAAPNTVTTGSQTYVLNFNPGSATGADPDTATVTRGYSGGSMLTHDSDNALTLANLALDGGYVATDATPITCTGNGGIVNVTKGTLNIGTDAALQNSKAENGGAMYIDGTAVVSVSDGANITGNTAANGGGIYVAGAGRPASGTDPAQEALTMTGGTISGNTATNGGAIYVAKDATVTLEDGTKTVGTTTTPTHAEINGNTATNGGAGIYLEQGSRLNLSGNLSFGGTDRNADGSLRGEEGNFVLKLKAGGDALKNGGQDYPKDASDNYKVRQDIYIAGYNETDSYVPATSVYVTGEIPNTITNDVGDRDGSIWIWAEAPTGESENNHVQQLKQFAVFTGGLADEAEAKRASTVRVFRNAADDTSTDNGTDSYLTGDLEGDLDAPAYAGYIYWSGVKGFRRVILNKVDSDNYTALEGAKLTVYKGSSTTAYKWKDRNKVKDPQELKDLQSMASGVFWVGELPFGTYYVQETKAPSAEADEAYTAKYRDNKDKWFCLIVDAEGVWMSEKGYNETGEGKTDATNKASALADATAVRSRVVPDTTT